MRKVSNWRLNKMDADHKQHEINEILPYLRPDFLELDKYHKAIKNELHSHFNLAFHQRLLQIHKNQSMSLWTTEKPLITVPIGKQIVETVVSYTFGKRKLPKVSAKTTRDIYPGKGYSLDAVNANWAGSLLNWSQNHSWTQAWWVQ